MTPSPFDTVLATCELRGAETTEGRTTTMEDFDARREIEDLKIAQATQAATLAGAQATQAATLAGAQATQAATEAGLAATNAAAHAGTIGMVVAGSIGVVAGLFLGMTIKG